MKLQRQLLMAVFMLSASLAAGQSPMPPRTVDDVVRMIRTARIDADELEKAKLTLAAPLAEGKTGKDLAEIHLARGRAAEILGLTDQYLKELRAAWWAAKAGGGRANLQLGVELTAAETHAGNLATALQIQEEIAATSQSGGSRLASHAFLTENKARHGDLAAAKEHFRKAESEFFDLQRSRVWGNWGLLWQANMERARGGLAMGYGKHQDAERSFRKSAELREQDLPQNLRRLSGGQDTLPQRIMIGFMLINRKAAADMVAQQGRLVEAEVMYRDILRLALAEFGAGSPLALVYVDGLAKILLEQGRTRDAEHLATAVLEILEKQGAAPESRMVTLSRQQIAAARVADRRWAEALAQYEAIRATLAKDAELERRLGRGNVDWSLALVRVGRSTEAVQMMEALVAGLVTRGIDGDWDLAEARGFLGLALAAAGRQQESLAAFRKALPVLLAGLQESGDSGVTARTRRLVVVLEAYLDLLFDTYRKQDGAGNIDLVAEAFQIADAARGSAVQRALTASSARAAIRDPKLATLARDEQDLGNRIATLSETLSRLESAPADAQLTKIIGEMRRDIPALKQQRHELRSTIGREFPDYAALVDPKPITAPATQKLLRTDEALVAIYVGERRTYIWALKANGPVAFAAAELGSAAIADRVGKLRQTLDLGEKSAIADADFDITAAHELYVQLLQPVAAAFTGARSLLVVPHAALGQLPFGLLPTQAGALGKSTLPFDAYRQVPWLIRQVAVTQLPSVNALAALRRQSPIRADERLPFVGFGDPLFNTREVSESAAPTAPVKLASRSIGVRFGPGKRDAHSATIADLARLPDTATEVREIAAALKVSSPDDIRLGKNASESAVLRGNLARYRVIAFATHGLVPGDINGLTQPALALSNPAITGETDTDGLLTMEEVLGLRLNADWVVLSACNTAAGEGTAAEAVSGLGRAFFYAGARALLVTNWPVETVSARLITTELFTRQAAQASLSRAEALRQAMLAVMDKNALDEKSGQTDFSYAHPLFWAPFSLVGDGAGTDH